MQGSSTELMTFLDGVTKRFVIPCYQRKYDWKIENCAQLYSDLKSISPSQHGNHFFGSIVYSTEAYGHITRHCIVDGQQRITTVMLLLLAIRNLLNDGVVHSDDQSLADKIDGFLIAPHEQEFKGIKLWPIDEDKEAFEKLVDGDEVDFVKNSNMTRNYEYFCRMIAKEEISVDNLYNAVYKLEIICISLQRGDNPQRIFESINSTGMPLSEGDKVRNYILMGLSSQKQTELFNEHWKKIEISVSENKDKSPLSDFLRDYLSIKQQTIPNKDRVYVEFKSYVEGLPDWDSDSREAFTEKLLKDMVNYARLYEKLYTCESGIAGETGKKIDNSLYRLKRLGVVVLHPFLMEILNICDEHGGTDGVTITPDDVLKICTITESYLLRRYICDLPSNAHSKIFLTLNQDVLRFDKTTNDYVSKFIYVLQSKSGTGLFPRDDEFVEAIEVDEIYQMRLKNYRDYMFERFENFGTKETKDVYSHLDSGDYSIEHIMPQHLTPAWVESLGDEYEDVYKTWLHRLANLTLTAYNSNLSNGTFLQKRDEPSYGYKYSGLRMNQKIAQKDSWGEPELKERSRYMADQAKTIWKFPETSFVPGGKDKGVVSYTLADDVDYTGHKIAGYYFLKTEQNVLSWTKLFENVIRILYQRDESIILDLVYGGSSDELLNNSFKSIESGLLRAMKIDDNVYVEVNTDTRTKIRMLRRLFDLYKINQSELILYLQD